MINSGIYKIVNLVNNKIYVGSSSDLKRRKYDHFYDLKNNKHKNNYLQNSFNKYKEKNFMFIVLEYIDNIENKEEFKQLILDRENYWIKELNACDNNFGYNMCKIADSCLGRECSDSTRKKLEIKNKGQVPWIKGKGHSDCTREKLRKSKLGELNPMYGKHHSKEHRMKISISNIGKKLSKESIEKRSEKKRKKVINLDTRKIFNSITEAAEYYSIPIPSIGQVCLGNRKTTGGYRWEYYKEVN